MTKDDRDARIRAEWAPWKERNFPHKDKLTLTQAMGFHAYLKAKEPDLLDFDYPGDDWQEFKPVLKRLGLAIEDHEAILKRGE